MDSKSTSKVFANSIIYSISGLLMKCFSFFLLPLYTSFLTTKDYGIINLANSFTASMIFIVAFSLYSAVLRFYVDFKDDRKKLKRFYGTIVTFVGASGIVFFILLFLFRNLLSKYVFSGLSFYPVILVCLVSLIFNCEYNVYDKILKSQQNALKSSIISLAVFFATLIFNIVFVVFFKLGAFGVLLASLIVYIIFTIIFIVDMKIRDSIEFCVDFGILKESLKYSVPIIPHNLSASIAVLISSVLIGNKVSISSLGIYSVASQFGNIADTVQAYVNNAYGPWLFEKLKSSEPEYKNDIRKTVKLICWAIGFFMIGISLFSQDYIVLFVNKAYLGSWKYTPFIVMVYTIKMAYYFYVSVLLYYKKASKYLFVATLSGSLCNILLSAVFIPAYGVYGSIIADMIAMLIRVSIVIFISKRFADIGLRIKDFIYIAAVIVFFIFAGVSLSYFFYSDRFSIINFAYKIMLLLIYIVILFLRCRKECSKYLVDLVSKIKKW